MSARVLSLAVVGVDYPNKDKGNRRFEILLCKPGDPVGLVLEPKNPADPNAVMVLSERNVQIGYLTAERAPWIGSILRDGRELETVFQEATPYGCVIRAGIDGAVPTLPPPPPPTMSDPQLGPVEDDSGFFPDYIPPDD